MSIDFPAGWGFRGNLSESIDGALAYNIDALLALLLPGVSWAHWGPWIVDHSAEGWSPCVPVFDGITNTAGSLMTVPDKRCFLVGNDQQQMMAGDPAALVTQDALDAAIAKQADQLDIIRAWSRYTGKAWSWAGPQWNVSIDGNLEQMSRWLHRMRQFYGYPRPHRLAIHIYVGSADEFWRVVDDFEAWRKKKLDGVRVFVTEFSGWPGVSQAEQMTIMEAGREYLDRKHVEWVAWFSGYPFKIAGRPWGTELARVDDAGGVALTALGEHWRELAR